MVTRAARSLDKAERHWSIREMCAAFGVTPRALRFYEDKGLLAPRRRGVSRLYGARDHARLALIVRGKRVGFSLTELGEMLDLYDERDGGAAQMAAAVPRFRARIDALRRQRDDIDEAVATLQTGVARLECKLAALPADLLPQAQDYDAMLSARLDGHAAHHDERPA